MLYRLLTNPIAAPTIAYVLPVWKKLSTPIPMRPSIITGKAIRKPILKAIRSKELRSDLCTIPIVALAELFFQI